MVNKFSSWWTDYNVAVIPVRGVRCPPPGCALETPALRGTLLAVSGVASRGRTLDCILAIRWQVDFHAL